jgi:hypothetical protein
MVYMIWKTWNNWPYWLKGGTVSVMFPIIVFVMNFLVDSFQSNSGEKFLYFFLIVSGPAVLIFDLFLVPSIPYNVTYMIFFTTTLAMYFVLGSVIGRIIGKRKS